MNNKLKLFTIGPVTLHERTLKIKGEQITHFRTDEFYHTINFCEKHIKKLVETSDNSRCVFLSSSGTGGMEASVLNILNENDKVLIINGGTYGSRFKKICDVYHIPNDTLDIEKCHKFDPQELDKYDNKGYTALLVNLHETSVGQLYPILPIKDFCQRNNCLLMVDAISTFLCDEYKMDEWGIDVTIISSQKGLALDPGLAMVIINEKTLGRINPHPMSLYFDFNIHNDYMSDFMTAFTPTIAIFHELEDMLHYIEQYKKENILKDNEEKAKIFRENVKDLPVKKLDYPMSNALTPLFFDEDVDVYYMYEILKNKYNMVVNYFEPDNQIRVSHIGNTTVDDMLELVDNMKSCIRLKKGLYKRI